MILDKWQKFQNKQAKWSDSTFGDRHGDTYGILYHLKEEVEELIEDPLDITEYADCFSMLIDGARITGFSMEDIYKAMEDKLKINKLRTWNEPDINGIIRHKK